MKYLTQLKTELEDNGISVLDAIPADDQTDAEIKLENDYFIQVGDNYFVYWKMQDGRYEIIKEYASFHNLLKYLKQNVQRI